MLHSITIEHVLKAGSFAPHHCDRFDRMLIAQALLEGYTIVTRPGRQAFRAPVWPPRGRSTRTSIG